MNRTRPVKIIKEQERNAPEPHPEDDSAPDPNRWSAAVGSWVEEFQQQRHIELLPGFDSLFKDSLLSGKAQIGPKAGAQRRVSTGRKRKRPARSGAGKKAVWPQVT
jgi:hypothetical protein